MFGQFDVILGAGGEKDDKQASGVFTGVGLAGKDGAPLLRELKVLDAASV